MSRYLDRLPSMWPAAPSDTGVSRLYQIIYEWSCAHVKDFGSYTNGTHKVLGEFGTLDEANSSLPLVARSLRYPLREWRKYVNDSVGVSFVARNVYSHIGPREFLDGIQLSIKLVGVGYVCVIKEGCNAEVEIGPFKDMGEANTQAEILWECACDFSEVKARRTPSGLWKDKNGLFGGSVSWGKDPSEVVNISVARRVYSWGIVERQPWKSILEI